MNINISAFVTVNENTSLGISDDDKLILITQIGNQQTLTTIGNMTEYTFNGLEEALRHLRIFIPNKDPKPKSALANDRI